MMHFTRGAKSIKPKGTAGIPNYSPQDLRPMNLPKIQHYVPQFLLRNFSRAASEQIFAFDLTTKRSFETNIKNIAAQKGFYNFESDEGGFSMEPVLSELENSASGIIREICRQKTLSHLDEDDMGVIALFMAIQFSRTPMARTWRDQVQEAVLKKFGDSPEAIAQIEKILPSGEKASKNAAIHFLATTAHEQAKHFLNKTWFLFETSTDDPFYISDNPIALFNSQKFGAYGNLGLAVPGIQITLPISPTFALGFYCPSFMKECLERVGQYQELLKVDPVKAAKYSGSINEVVKMIGSANDGSPISMSPENVIFVNSRQVGFCSRFVFSGTNEFSLALDMAEKGDLGWGKIQVD
jgi:hypothetical protein